LAKISSKILNDALQNVARLLGDVSPTVANYKGMGAGNSDTAAAATQHDLLGGSYVAMGGAVADDGGVQTDETTAANDATINDMTLLPAVPAVGDAYYFGHATEMFSKLKLKIGTAGAGVWTITWEYWNGSAWTALSGVTDGTTHFRATAGDHEVTFTLPSNWAKTTIEAINAYWIRARVSAYTSITTQPKGTQSWIWGNVHYDDVTPTYEASYKTVWVNTFSYGDLTDHIYKELVICQSAAAHASKCLCRFTYDAITLGTGETLTFTVKITCMQGS